VLLSLNVPVAVNCFAVPTAMLELAGVTAMDTNVAAVTVSDALPVTDPEVYQPWRRQAEDRSMEAGLQPATAA
jgi:hypothetical protein